MFDHVAGEFCLICVERVLGPDEVNLRFGVCDSCSEALAGWWEESRGCPHEYDGRLVDAASSLEQ